MTVVNDFLSKDDYNEQICPLNMHPEVAPVPIGRITEKLDSYLSHNQYDAAERHLKYWLLEADTSHDLRGKLLILNEQIGIYRKTGKENECLYAVSNALSLAESMKIESTVMYGTTLVNAATGYKAFGKAKDAFPLYRKARTIYESTLNSSDERLAALYNNMALTLVDLKEFSEAKELYFKAIEIMENQENGSLEVAITYLNLADLVVAKTSFEAGEKEIENYLDKAEELLNKEGLPRDGYYAFVCEKCAPVFGYYGYFLVEKELNRRAKEIYERT